jgi:hypothetical protein
MAGGRPDKYKPEFTQQAKRLSILGLTDSELAKFFEVEEKTINNWKKKFPEFLQSLKEGKDLADSNVVAKLYQRAMGYEHPETKFFVVRVGKDEDEIQTRETVKIYPPDVTAMIFWLKNRRPQQWRDKVEVDPIPQNLTVTISGPTPPPNE